MKSYKMYAFVVGALCAVNVYAQPVVSRDEDFSKVYFKVYGAYGFLAPGSFKGNSEIITNEPVRFNVSKTGMGAGIRGGAGMGFIVNRFINIGLDGEYLAGKKTLLHQDISSMESKANHASGYSLEGYRSIQHQVLSIVPNIVFKAISKQNYYIYNRLGVVIGIPLNITENYFQHYNYVNPDTVNVTPHTLLSRDASITYNGKYILKPSVGYQFAIGAQFVISDRLRASFEIVAYSISLERDKYEDIGRLNIEVERKKNEIQQPTVFDHSRYVYEYISSGATGTNTKGVPFNYVTTVKYAQDPVIMNAITAGLGIAYRF
jgi:hypothetical protein